MSLFPLLWCDSDKSYYLLSLSPHYGMITTNYFFSSLFSFTCSTYSNLLIFTYTFILSFHYYYSVSLIVIPTLITTLITSINILLISIPSPNCVILTHSY